jgi:DNA-directed RNA polymerase subunit RPC12/RpoP
VVGEICKYSAKVPGDSSWWREPTLVPSPQLAAAWEIATWGARLLERYGAARQLPPQPPEEKEVDDQIQCDRCGATVEECAIPTGIWVRLCETAGVQPFGRASPNGRRGMTRISCATCGEPVDPATAHWDRDRGTICLACWRAIVTPVHVATRRLTAEERQITLDEWITGKGKVNGQKKKDRK